MLRAPAVALYSVIFYTMMGLKKDAGAFFVFLGILELFVTCTVSLTTLIALAYKGSPAVGNLIRWTRRHWPMVAPEAEEACTRS